MSGFLRFAGSAFLFLWFATLFFGMEIEGFFPDEYKSYSRELTNNKWLLLLLGIALTIIGSITKVIKNKKQTDRTNNMGDSDSSAYKISFSENTSFKSSEDTNSSQDLSYKAMDKFFDKDVNEKYSKKNFVKEQQQYKGREFANKQRGKLKEIAMKTEWTPLASGGSNFKTSELKQVNSSRLEVHKSVGGLLFSGLFDVVGLGIIAFGSYFLIQDDGLSFNILLPIVFGGAFAAAGIGMIIYPRPRVFDRRYGWFWVGNKSLAREQDFIKLKKSARLSEIVAIQIIDERCSGNKSGTYTSWEINLVSDDGQRVNVMDHGNKFSIRSDARQLGEFLGVPVWENS